MITNYIIYGKTKQVTTVIKPKSIVEHEHDFVKETNRSPIHCSTCRAVHIIVSCVVRDWKMK
jgi:hypothetical protein